MGERVYKMLSRNGFEPPRTVEIAERLKMGPKQLDEVLGFLTRQGRLSRISDDLYLTEELVSELKEKVRSFIVEHQSMAPADMKQIVDVSRKFAIPYLEYLDRIHFTVRVDNARRLGSGK
jgi:selenocysteine-specific elongation factor